MQFRSRKLIITPILTPPFLFALIFLYQSSAAAPVGGVCTVDDSGGAQYTTIKDAIDNVSCTTIQVAGGTYVEVLGIHRDLALNGAGSNLTIIEPTSPSSTPLYVSGDNVSVAGITLQNGGTGLYLSGANVTAADLHIQDNVKGVNVDTECSLSLENSIA